MFINPTSSEANIYIIIRLFLTQHIHQANQKKAASHNLKNILQIGNYINSIETLRTERTLYTTFNNKNILLTTNNGPFFHTTHTVNVFKILNLTSETHESQTYKTKTTKHKGRKQTNHTPRYNSPTYMSDRDDASNYDEEVPRDRFEGGAGRYNP